MRRVLGRTQGIILRERWRYCQCLHRSRVYCSIALGFVLSKTLGNKQSCRSVGVSRDLVLGKQASPNTLIAKYNEQDLRMS